MCILNVNTLPSALPHADWRLWWKHFQILAAQYPSATCACPVPRPSRVVSSEGATTALSSSPLLLSLLFPMAASAKC